MPSSNGKKIDPKWITISLSIIIVLCSIVASYTSLNSMAGTVKEDLVKHEIANKTELTRIQDQGCKPSVENKISLVVFENDIKYIKKEVEKISDIQSSLDEIKTIVKEKHK